MAHEEPVRLRAEVSIGLVAGTLPSATGVLHGNQRPLRQGRPERSAGVPPVLAYGKVRAPSVPST